VAFRFVAGAQSEATWLGGRIDDYPSAILREHLYVAPFLSPGFDASVSDLVRLLGADHVVFGSDWPHGEGRASPLAYVDELAPLAARDRVQVMYRNGADLLGLPPAGDPPVGS
jgi:predicted TIM-barrel fold metal-dependent hydrolase